MFSKCSGQVFLRCFRDPIRIPRMENRSLESEKIIIGVQESEKIGSLESENRVSASPNRIPYIFLKKKNWFRYWSYITFANTRLGDDLTSSCQVFFCEVSATITHMDLI